MALTAAHVWNLDIFCLSLEIFRNNCEMQRILIPLTTKHMRKFNLRVFFTYKTISSEV